MDKRNFIKTLGALSVSSLVSASELTKIKSVSHKRINSIAIYRQDINQTIPTSWYTLLASQNEYK